MKKNSTPKLKLWSNGGFERWRLPDLVFGGTILSFWWSFFQKAPEGFETEPRMGVLLPYQGPFREGGLEGTLSVFL